MQTSTVPNPLVDADLASRDPLAAEARATTPVLSVVHAPDPDVLADRLFAEFRAAWAAGDEDRMAEVIVDAIELDMADPHGPRLMDEIRGLSTPAVA